MLIEPQKLDINKLKLIIWDLDNTFWSGTLSEEHITEIPKNIELVKELTRRGIVNSICSKNNYESCKTALVELGVWDYFVFPSIDWSPKSERLYSIISDMNLRPENTLFLDDEPANLQRALVINENLMCGTSDTLSGALYAQIDQLKIDDTCARLAQYKELQLKVETQRKYDSDDEFLRISDIRVSISYDCLCQVDRILELINRTNQLNYTKLRCTKNQLETILKDSQYKCAYISCTDKFCNYGIVGFFALDISNHALMHFLFSCRTIGMGIEQFVYSYISYPKLEIVGDVVTDLKTDECPDWIQLSNCFNANEKTLQRTDYKILIKGPCDVSQIVPFFADESIFDAEFAYVSQSKKGMFIESFNHTSQILLSRELNEQEKKELIRTIPFIDEEYFHTNLFSNEYDYVIFSLLTDYGLGLYQNKQNNKFTVAFGQYTINYTETQNWNNIINYWIKESCYDIEKTAQEYNYFQENYEFIGRISDAELVRNLQLIRDALPEHTKLILLNGAELPYNGQCKDSHKGRDKLHAHLNKIVKDFVQKNSNNCFIIDVNTYLQSEDPYLDTINHYKKAVYYRLANAINCYISNTNPQISLQTKRLSTIYLNHMLNLLRRGVKKLKRILLRR